MEPAQDLRRLVCRSTMNTSKFSTTYEGITLGDAGVAMVVEEVPGVTSGENWHLVPKNAYDIAKSLDKSRGFICAKDRGKNHLSVVYHTIACK